jgi:drug/metabolite transporter (DMT)-like permease
MRRLIYSLVASFVFALSTLMMIEFPVLSSITIFARIERLLSILLMPGFFVGFTVSGNIHVTSPWVVISANFVFYFGLAYLLLMVSDKLKAKSQGRRQVPVAGRSTPPV